jgi:hypothetical protein
MSASIQPDTSSQYAQGLGPEGAAGHNDSSRLPRAPQLVMVHAAEPPMVDSEGVIRSRLWPATIPQIADETSGFQRRGRTRSSRLVRIFKTTSAFCFAVIAAWSLGSVLFPNGPGEALEFLSGSIAMIAQGTQEGGPQPSDSSSFSRSPGPTQITAEATPPVSSGRFVVASADNQPRLQPSPEQPQVQQPQLQPQPRLEPQSQRQSPPQRAQVQQQAQVQVQQQSQPPQWPIQQPQVQQLQPAQSSDQPRPQLQGQLPQPSQSQPQQSQALQAPQPQQAPAPQAPAPQAQAPQKIEHLSPEETKRLMDLGTKFLAQGDLATARHVLERVAQAGDARANLLLGATYDPEGLKKLGMIGVPPDLKKAQSWYTRAAELGSREASQRLTVLGQAGR